MSSYRWCGQYQIGLYSLLLFQNHFLLLLLLAKWWKNTTRTHLLNINSDEATISSRKIFHAKLLPAFVHRQALLGPVGQTNFKLAQEEALMP